MKFLIKFAKKKACPKTSLFDLNDYVFFIFIYKEFLKLKQLHR